ncbi:MAG: heme o synthase [Myxococcota bacterium]
MRNSSAIAADRVARVDPTETPSFGALYELSKPNLTLLVVITAVLGFYMASTGDSVRWDRLIALIIGTALTSAGACALNMYIERDIDARMPRTRKRPIPSGRVTPEVALFFVMMTLSWGFGLLATFCGPIPAALSLMTAGIYAFIYTPLKRRGPLSIWVGAIPGAVPPLMGWAAATGRIDWGGAALFLILFAWQFPHFIALAYMYREDYRRAGFHFLPKQDPEGRKVGLQIAGGGLALLIASVLPVMLGVVGPIYAVGVVAIGLWFLKVCLQSAFELTGKSARRVFLGSIKYLPIVLALLVIDRIIL